MQSKLLQTPSGPFFDMLITLARTSDRPRHPDNPSGAQPHRDHPLWSLNTCQDSATLQQLGWRLLGYQDDGSVLMLPDPVCLSGGGVHTLQAASGAHKRAGCYVAFEVRDANGLILFHHPLDTPMEIEAGQRLTVNFGVEVVDRVTAPATGLGASADVVATPPKLVETE